MANEPKRSQVEEASEKLVVRMEMLDKLSSVLVEKTTPVRAQRPQVGKAMLAAQEDKDSKAPLADFLNKASNHAEIIGNRLELLIGELEC